MKKILARSSFAISILLFIGTLISQMPCSYNSRQQDFLVGFKPINNEAFDQDLAKVRNLDELKTIIRTEVDGKKLSGIEIPVLIDNYVRNKFQHGLALLKPCDNWVNHLFSVVFTSVGLNGTLLWAAYSPEDIVRSKGAICSQQAWMFQKLIKDYHFDYGTVSFNGASLGHIASSVKVDGVWYYFDPDLEPDYTDAKPPLLKHILEGNEEELSKIYGSKSKSIFTTSANLSITPWVEAGRNNEIKVISINQRSEWFFLLFQVVAKIISNFGFILFLFIGIWLQLLIKSKN